MTTSDLAPSTYGTADADTATSYGGDPTAAVAAPRVGRHARPTDDAPAFWTEKKESDEDEDDSIAPIKVWTPPPSAVMPQLPLPASEPMLDQPAAEAVAAQAPAAQAPAAQAPVAQAPVAQAPAAQAPAERAYGTQAYPPSAYGQAPPSTEPASPAPYGKPPAPYDAAPAPYSPAPRYDPPQANLPYIGPFPTKRRRVSPALAGLLVVALLAGAGFGAKTYLDHRSSQSTASVLSSKPLSSAQLANYALLPADLPPGWTAVATASGSSASAGAAATAANGTVFSSQVDTELSSCVGVKNTDPDQVGLAKSPDFGSGTNTISSTANSFHSPTDVTNGVALFTSPKSSACLTTELQKSIPTTAGVTFSDVAVTTSGRLAGQPSDVAVNLAETMVASANGNSIKVSASVVFLAKNLTMTEVDFFGLGSPVPTDVQQSVIAKLAAKLAQ